MDRSAASRAVREAVAAASPRRARVLFLCTGNSCRSQMAEGWARALAGDAIEAHSAGTHPKGLDPRAVQIMAEAGVDISGHASKRPQDIGGEFDVVVTVCDGAAEACPVFAGARVVHAGFDDPPRLSAGAASEGDALRHYRRVRDEIRAFVDSCLGAAEHGAIEGGSTMTTKKNTRDCGCDDGCCSSGAPQGAKKVDPDAVREKVREGYATIAEKGGWSEGGPARDAGLECDSGGGCCGGSGGGGCCGPATFTGDQLAEAIGYSSGEQASVPEGANMGLSCGNPTALASLREGEVVLDLGSGAGFDCFIAGAKVGATGRVIGVDMTPEMISRARRFVPIYREKSGLDNVEFRLGEIEHLPVPDASVDVVISNCVINLSPDKAQTWREIARVLMPGGRVAVSDLALLKPLPQAVVQDVEALVGCVAGAELVEETKAHVHAAGLTRASFTAKSAYIEAMDDWDDPLYRKIVQALPKGSKPSDYITSLDVTARK